jgi:NADH dehydrogenase FAD-containing subunit
MAQKGAGKIVIYGGGIAGGVLAKRLSSSFRVTLVDPLDYFEVPMATPRNLVKPSFAERAIMPFATALPSAEHVQAKLAEMTPAGGIVEHADGSRTLVPADISVLATGSRFANQLMRAFEGSAARRKAFYERFNQRLATADRVLIVGGGPIGVEMAGELTETYPGRSVTIVEAGPRLLRGTSEAVASHANSVLARRGVVIITGDRLDGSNSPTDDVFAAAGEARTLGGRRIPYDLILWCTGGRPNTAYMQSHFADRLDHQGRIKVAPDLRVRGETAIFAIGDITDLAENKMALHIGGQIKIAEANVRSILLAGRSAGTLKTYRPQTNNPMMVVTLGSRAGVTHAPPFGVIRSAWLNRKVKATDMLVPRFRKAFGV